MYKGTTTFSRSEPDVSTSNENFSFSFDRGAAHREICQAINRLLYSKLYRENNALKLYISAEVFGLRRQRMSRFYLFIFILLKLQIGNTFML